MLKNLIVKVKSNTHLYSTAAVFLIMILALLIRVRGLGVWPLAEDEFYLVKSINNVLKYGIPHWDSGGYYVRGLFNQYLTAPLFLMGIDTEFGARIFPVIFNILTIIPLFVLTKKVSNNTIALIVSLLFCLSVWEIEMARFARMYTAFQMIFVFYFLALFKAIFENSSKARWLMYIISAFSAFVHEAGIFLAILNFTDILWKREIKVKYLIYSSIVFIFVYGFLSFSFWNLGSVYPYPTDVDIPHSENRSTFQVPSILLVQLLQNTLWVIIFFPLLAFTVFRIYRVVKSVKLNFNLKIYVTSIALLSVLNLFGIIILVTVLCLLISLINRSDFSNKKLTQYLLIPVLYICFWLAFSLGNADALSTGLIKDTFVILFRYPDFWWWTKVFLQTIPYFTVFSISVIGLNFLLIVFNQDTKHKGTRFIYYILVIIVSIMASLHLTVETRYAFFFFPIILLLLIISIFNLCSLIFQYIEKQNKGRLSFKPIYVSVLFAFLILLYFGLSEDFNLNHISKIDSKEINFRMNYNSALSNHYYQRWDVSTPSEVINKELKPGDIVIANQLEVQQYLKRIDYIFIDYRNPRLLQQSVMGGKREKWTNANLIYKLSELDHTLSNNSSTTWFIEYRHNPYRIKELEEISFYNKYGKYLYFTSLDKNIRIYKIKSLNYSFSTNNSEVPFYSITSSKKLK